jgi:putative 4-mercaptohistidine N1-methyltranferase
MSEYAEFHYGDDYFGVANFSKSLAQLAIKTLGERPRVKALDLGCASGRASFELAQHFDEVEGVDFSARFISQAVTLAEGQTLRYTLVEEGELVSYKARSLKDLNLQGTQNKVAFSQGDACNLKPHLTDFDLVLAANLIDRLYSPAKFLGSIHTRIKIGGLLMLASPYTWLSEHTPREDWVGGFKKDGENFTTIDGLQAQLGKHFRLIMPPVEIPFVIRETKRKFQHSLSEVTFWERIN